MIYIQQAIYGEQEGHNLLKSSFENSNIPKRLSGFTDLVDRPPSRVLSMPIIRGFFEEEHFLLIKSFPDLTHGVRTGRVFSHALIIKKEEYLKLHDITKLLQYHLSEINRHAELDPIEYQNKKSVNKTAFNNRMAAAINGMAIHSDYENTILWVGDNGYLEWISKVWPNIPNKVKVNIRIGGAYDPKFINPEKLNLLHIPLELRPNWSKREYKITDEACKDKLDSQAANLLAGNSGDSEGLREILDSYLPEINEIGDLQLFENFIEDHQAIGSRSVHLKQLLILADLVSRRNPNTKSAIAGKQKLISAIISEIPNSVPAVINMLKYQSWKGFENAKAQINDPLISWLDSNLYSKGDDLEKARIVNEALSEKEATNWWKSTVRNYLTDCFKDWKDSYAISVWNWVSVNSNTISLFDSALPNKAEISLAQRVPKLKKKTGELILDIAQNKNWLYLHGLIAIKLYIPKEAFSRQLVVDTDRKHFEILQKMSDYVPSKDLVDIAISLGEDRLITISGKLIKKQPKLLSKLDIENSSWQKLWLIAVNEGADIWDGIPNPIKTVYKILDQILSGKNFDVELLSAIGKSNNNNLVNYPKRQVLWEKIPKNCYQNFLTSTTKSVLDKYLLGSIELSEIEKPISELIISDQFMASFLNTHRNNIENVIKVYEGFSNLKDQFLSDYIRHYTSTISASQALRLGTFVKQYSFSKTARCIYDKSKTNYSFKKAYLVCNNLVKLSFFEKIFDSPSNFSQVTRSKDMSSTNKIETQIPTVVILTAIKEEYQAVRSHLVKICDADIDSTAYEGGVFEFQGQNIANVIIRECGAKNTTSSQETERAITNFGPDMILFVGIAGSRKPNDFKIGDVIFPDKVYYYEGGKASKESFKARPDAVAPTFELIEKARKERNKEDWKCLIKGNYDRSPNADIGIIASGEQLIDHHDSEIGVVLTNHYNDSSAVEMEGYGFLKALDRQGKGSRNTLCGVVRGISDIIEQDALNQSSLIIDRRPDNAKQFASDSAAAFSYWLIFKATW